jgi:dolichyl-phosphate beta-glucosyltransferase
MHHSSLDHGLAASASHLAGGPAARGDSNAADHDLTVVIPAFNEQRRLPETLQELRRYLGAWGVDYRVIVADDGSRDGTAGIAADFGPRFSTISLPRNQGKGAAVRTGMRQAGGRVVAFMDADLPYALECLRRGYDVIETGCTDVVFGARDVDGAQVRVRRREIRMVASALFRGIVKILISTQVTDTQAGFKIFSRDAAQRIFSRATIDSFAFDAEIVFLTHQLRLRFRRQPVVLSNERGSTLSLARHTLPMLRDVLRVRWQSLRGAYRETPPPILPLQTATVAEGGGKDEQPGKAVA